VPILQASLEDPASLVALTEQTKVVVSTAGPYAQLGSPLVDACVKGGANYCDITGACVDSSCIACGLLRWSARAACGMLRWSASTASGIFSWSACSAWAFLAGQHVLHLAYLAGQYVLHGAFLAGQHVLHGHS
jgi:Saccharopine dehydrogenase NADP binding domain